MQKERLSHSLRLICFVFRKIQGCDKTMFILRGFLL